MRGRQKGPVCLPRRKLGDSSVAVTPRERLSGPREGCQGFSGEGGMRSAPGRWYSHLPALGGMVGEVIMKDCCDIHSTDLPTGVSGRRREHIAVLHKLVQRYIWCCASWQGGKEPSAARGTGCPARALLRAGTETPQRRLVFLWVPFCHGDICNF